ncbi:hypothetical protein EVG20_g3025 [Dentipellis fragilis]|uniref:CHAT domain-containing protein n=1 Tax=Dentipellis fragilis TaxID=205917 RepID=A0A4Y9Z6R4_9AGAM|nr:hypothetical protein EVG20_g3025 [Dentipellis fragilis]
MGPISDRPTASVLYPLEAASLHNYYDTPRAVSQPNPHANAAFAFLSACQTSAGDEALSDEAVHLAAGMQMAGYRSVVATMWSIKDGPTVASEFYRRIFDNGRPDCTRATHALHDAVIHLREDAGKNQALPTSDSCDGFNSYILNKHLCSTILHMLHLQYTVPRIFG